MEIIEKTCTHKIKIEGYDFNGTATVQDGHIKELKINIFVKGSESEIDLDSEEIVRGLSQELNKLIEFLDKEKKLGHE
jgi:hypothetical protein